MKILLVEDETTIREVEKLYLERTGYTVATATDGEEALTKFTADIDIVLLDINLPKKDGITVCREIRAKSQVPIIMITARVEEIDELVGLEIGADDYIKKPFSPQVMLARVQAVLRRREQKEVKVKDLLINPEKMHVTKDTKRVLLTTTQFNILYTMASNPGKVYSRNEILEQGYGTSIAPDVLDRTVDAHIKSIRKAIEKQPNRPEYILTVIGKGYKFNDE
jgi:DNA-binding response OmpR family regulator